MRVAITRSVDLETKNRLRMLGRATKRGEGYVIDWLVDEAYKRIIDPGHSQEQAKGSEDGD